MKKTFYRLTYENDAPFPEELKNVIPEEAQSFLRPHRKDCDVEIYRTLWTTSVVIVKRTPREPIQAFIEQICTLVVNREKFIFPRLVAWYEDHRCDESLHFTRVHFKYDRTERRLTDPKWGRVPGGRSSFFASIPLDDPGKDISAYRKHEEADEEEAHVMISSWTQGGLSLDEKIELLENDGRNRSHLFSYYPQEFFAVIRVRMPGQKENIFAYRVEGTEQLHALFLSCAHKCRISKSELILAITTETYLKETYPHLEVIPWKR